MKTDWMFYLQKACIIQYTVQYKLNGFPLFERTLGIREEFFTKLASTFSSYNLLVAVTGWVFVPHLQGISLILTKRRSLRVGSRVRFFVFLKPDTTNEQWKTRQLQSWRRPSFTGRWYELKSWQPTGRHVKPKSKQSI